MSKPKISTIIASKNAQEDLKKCLTSIFDNCNNEDIEVIVSDNNSIDGTLEMIAEFFPQVKLCNSQHDISYASAINRGIKASGGEYLLCLDSDVIIHKKTRG